MWSFCLRSLLREYGWQFIRRIAGPHPIRTTKAVLASGAIDVSGSETTVGAPPPDYLQGPDAIVGVGFCLKPIFPQCPSGRSNHDCQYFENPSESRPSEMPSACRRCAIRRIGLRALHAGAAFYVMTSAKDILLDVFVPALETQRFQHGLFTLCRYSLRPFAVGLLASGMQGQLIAFESGDCQDYHTWLLADRGIKEEQTKIDRPSQTTITRLLAHSAKRPPRHTRFAKQGNVFYACSPPEEPSRPGLDPAIVTSEHPINPPGQDPAYK